MTWADGAYATWSLAVVLGLALWWLSASGRTVAERRIAPAGSLIRQLTRHPALRVVVVHPDLLGTYGDGGNGLVLANRALWRGLDVELLLASSDRPLPESGDLYCLGGGEDGPQLRAAALLARSPLARAIDGGAAWRKLEDLRRCSQREAHAL